MSLNGHNKYCNPSVENIAKEILMAQEILFHPYAPNLLVHSIKIYETPNCFTMCYGNSMSQSERDNFYAANYESIKAYRDNLGVLEYDDRKL
jgi:6-pyruvoyltetrahydropterin/6-carboxytetrahydropterin synthase